MFKLGSDVGGGFQPAPILQGTFTVEGGKFGARISDVQGEVHDDVKTVSAFQSYASFDSSRTSGQFEG